MLCSMPADQPASFAHHQHVLLQQGGLLLAVMQSRFSRLCVYALVVCWRGARFLRPRVRVSE